MVLTILLEQMNLLFLDTDLAILETAGIRIKEKRDCQLDYGFRWKLILSRILFNAFLHRFGKMSQNALVWFWQSWVIHAGIDIRCFQK
jgi:hypothetical protein